MTSRIQIDLHIHSSTGSDGALPLKEIFAIAARMRIGFVSITDHGAIHHQEEAIELATGSGIRYVTGVELNVYYPYNGKEYSLDFLGYGFDYADDELNEKLAEMKEYDSGRARKILGNLNQQFMKERRPLLTEEDLTRMQEGIEGVLSRPHIADYLELKNIVTDRREAFERYLVSCNVPRYPLRLADASRLVRNAGGKLVLAHPNDGNGTSLNRITTDLHQQTNLISRKMLDHIDGIECWHSRSDGATSAHYVEFCREYNLMMTGGSDCHQKPMLLGSVDVPAFVAKQFNELWT